MTKFLLAALAALTLFSAGAAAHAQNWRGGDDRPSASQGRDRYRDEARPRDRWARGNRPPPGRVRERAGDDEIRGQRLRRPPPGFHWVRLSSGRYALTSRQTGRVFDVVG